MECSIPTLSVVLRERRTLPKGLAPAGELRDRQSEKKKAVARATAKAVAAQGVALRLERVPIPNGDATEVYCSLATGKTLAVAPKAPVAAVTVGVVQRRLAIASRWHKARLAASITSGTPLQENVYIFPAPVDGHVRHARRGEFNSIKAEYRAYDTSELLHIVYAVKNKSLKMTEVKKLYADGKIKVSPTSVGNVLYPKEFANEKILKLEKDGLAALGAPRRVLSPQQEQFAMALCIEMALHNKPLSVGEIIRWAQLTAKSNGTRVGDEDMRAWYNSFVGRVRKDHGIDLKKVETQQLSKQRSGVLLSGVRAFQSMVGNLLSENSLLAAAGLTGTGNWDELKMDLNKLLTDGTSVVPVGMVPRWEVDGERCEQITLLVGYVGYRTGSTPNPAGKCVSLNQVNELIAAGNFPSFGSVAGYPKIPPGFWDGPDFCVLVGLLIFKGKAGADPAWLNLVHDKTRLMVATTESGYINTELKYEWYKACKALEHCPYGKRPTIPNADSHASNESIEMSAEMELEDGTFLVAPPGHSTHILQQMDQSGGPIQHLKHIERDLVRSMYRLRGKLSKARVAQTVELAITLAFTPLNCSWATKHVSWDEDSEGKLIYAPLSSARILAELVDDESQEQAEGGASVAILRNASQLGTTPSPSATALAAFKAGEMDGELGVAAARQAALAVLGRSKLEGDGWDDEEEMEEVIEVEGSRSRRRGLPNGRLVSCQQFRESKAAQGRSASEAAALEEHQAFKKRGAIHSQP